MKFERVIVCEFMMNWICWCGFGFDYEDNGRVWDDLCCLDIRFIVGDSIFRVVVYVGGG